MELGIANAGLLRSEATLRAIAAAALLRMQEAGLPLPGGALTAKRLLAAAAADDKQDATDTQQYATGSRKGPNRRTGTSGPLTKVCSLDGTHLPTRVAHD